MFDPFQQLLYHIFMAELSTMDVQQALERVLPINANSCYYNLATSPDAVSEQNGIILITTQLWLIEQGSVRSIKEQQCHFLPKHMRSIEKERFQAYLEGWATAIELVFEQRGVPDLERATPYDFVYPKTLELKKAMQADDFTKAFLAKSRMGKFIPTSKP
jgi:hypothetical protein